MITWKIVQLERLISDGFVFKAYWKCSLFDEPLLVDSSGVSNFEIAEPVIPFENLTEEEVLQWVWDDGVNKLEVEAELQEKMNQLKTPIAEFGMPWN